MSMVTGDVWIIRDKISYYADVGDILHPGDIIHTREKAYAKITSDLGVLINMDAMSHLKILSESEFSFPYGRFRLHSHASEKIWLRTPAFIAWPEQGQVAIDVFQQGAKVKSEIAVIGGKIFLSPVKGASDDVYQIDQAVMWDSFLYDPKNPATAMTKLPEHVFEKLVSDRMNRYVGNFLFDLIYPESPFPGSLGPRYELITPQPKVKMTARLILKARDRRFIEKGLLEDTRISGAKVAWYPRGFTDFVTDLRPYRRPHVREAHVDDFWDLSLVRPLTAYEVKNLKNDITP